MTIHYGIKVKDCFLLDNKKNTLERITEIAQAKGYFGIHNPPVMGTYVEDGNFVRRVKKLEQGQEVYEFRRPLLVYTKECRLFL